MKKLTIDEFIKKAKSVHENKYDYSKTEYFGSLKQISIICPQHGQFLQTANRHLLGSGCSKCAIEIHAKNITKHTTDSFISNAKKLHGSKYNYTETKYKNFYTKVCIICNKHGKFWQRPSHHVSGRGCPICSGKNKTTKHFIDESNEIHNFKYNYTNVVYKNSKTKVEILCKHHGAFMQAPVYHLLGQGCPKCVGYISKDEIKWLNLLNIPNTVNTRQVYIQGHKVDGYDPRTNTIYEFLGDYWHGNPVKYNSSEINKSCGQSYENLYKKTIKKFNKLKACGYTICYIWESDWKTNKNLINIY